MSPKKPG
jgi:hypothetical protein